MAGFLQVAGLRDLQKAIKAAGDDLDPDAGGLKDVNRKAAEVVSAAAIPATPRKSGKLAGSVRVGATNRAGIIRAGKGSVPYAGPIHWGWPRRHIKARPWIADKAAATEDRWTDVYLEAMNDLLDRIVKATDNG